MDGDSHFLDEKTESYDASRQKFIESYGVNFLRIMNHEILNDLGGAQMMIERKIKELEKKIITSPNPSL